jgi:hypothetical protein
MNTALWKSTAAQRRHTLATLFFQTLKLWDYFGIPFVPSLKNKDAKQMKSLADIIFSGILK